MTQLFDTHCHLQDAACIEDAADLAAAARASGVAGMLLCGYDRQSNGLALDLAERLPGVFPAVGFHPHDAKDLTDDAFDELRALAHLPQVLAVGEIGLDFYRDLSPRDVQVHALERQLGLALETGKPVSVHSRGAEDAILASLRDYSLAATALRDAGRPVGIMHCFGGTLEQAQAFVALGFLVSIACSVTYPKNEQTRVIARELPLASLVVETDSPYLPPQPLRGRRNEPANVRAAVEAIAQERRLSIEAVAEATTANACRVLGVRLPLEASA